MQNNLWDVTNYQAVLVLGVILYVNRDNTKNMDQFEKAKTVKKRKLATQMKL